MKRPLALLLACTGWFAVIAQYCLMLDNRSASIAETSIRFFSFFTILTNTLLAVYFSASSLNMRWSQRPGLLTALTVYISVVGLVYQVVLRSLWQPEGLQKIVDELLHSVIPLLTVYYWYRFENKAATLYTQIVRWLAYPLIYLVYILVRGSRSGFYPYPFVNAGELGLTRVLINAFVLLVFFVILSAAYIKAGHMLERSRQTGPGS